MGTDDVQDYDMRGLQRIEKNKGKKLKGSRKKKEARRAAEVAGQDFKVDTKDDRFRAVFKGDDSRFGIDKTDPNFKETGAMKDILKAQEKARKEKKRKPAVVGDSVAKVGEGDMSGGALALSNLVSGLKKKIKK